MRTALLAPCLATLLCATTRAQKLGVGDPAPSLSIGRWIAGEALPELAAGRIFVVEFFATWCAPCRARLIRLSDLQRARAGDGLTVVAVTSEGPDNDLAAVQRMVASAGDRLACHVAWDEGRATFEAWMRAAGQHGLPCSFLVGRDGKLAYVGHPMWLEAAVAGVIDGTWDPAAERTRIETVQRRLMDVFRAVASEPARAARDAEALVAEHAFLAEPLREARFRGWWRAGEHEKAYAAATEIVEQAIAGGDDAKLNEIAWTIVDPQSTVPERDLALAQRAAEGAVTLTGGKDASLLDTLARVHFWKGEIDQALELQRRAVAIDGQDELRKALAEYEAAARRR